MKVRERCSEGGASTLAWFTCFSGETVQAMVEPLVEPQFRVVADGFVARDRLRNTALTGNCNHRGPRHCHIPNGDGAANPLPCHREAGESPGEQTLSEIVICPADVTYRVDGVEPCRGAGGRRADAAARPPVLHEKT